MFEIRINKRVDKIIRSKQNSTKKKYNGIFNELKDIPFNGPYYRKLKGERLTKLEKKLNIEDFQIHSVELEDRLRLVYKYVESTSKIYITDLGNHEFEGSPYVEIFSESNYTFSMKT